MATPTITPLPEAPSRQNSAGTFATLADNFMAALPQFADQMNQSIDYVGDKAESAAESAQRATSNGAAQVELATQRANSASQSAQSAAQQAAARRLRRMQLRVTAIRRSPQPLLHRVLPGFPRSQEKRAFLWLQSQTGPASSTPEA